jgi:hypothetical protein
MSGALSETRGAIDWLRALFATDAPGWSILVRLLVKSSAFRPIAHIGYFREQCVVRRRWLDEHAYAAVSAIGGIVLALAAP